MKEKLFGFSVGDKVLCISPPDGSKRLVGFFGIVRDLNLGAKNHKITRLPIYVCFYNDEKMTREFSHWWCEPHTLKILSENKQMEFEF